MLPEQHSRKHSAVRKAHRYTQLSADMSVADGFETRKHIFADCRGSAKDSCVHFITSLLHLRSVGLLRCDMIPYSCTLDISLVTPQHKTR